MYEGQLPGPLLPGVGLLVLPAQPWSSALLRGDSGLPGQLLQVFLATEGMVVNHFLHYPLSTLSPSGMGWPLYFPAHPSWDTQARDGEQEFL